MLPIREWLMVALPAMLALLGDLMKPLKFTALRLRLRVAARLICLSLCVLAGAANDETMAMFLALDTSKKEGASHVPTAACEELQAKYEDKCHGMSSLVKSMFAPCAALDRSDAVSATPPLCDQDSNTTAVAPGSAASTASGPSQGSAQETPAAPALQRRRWFPSQEPASTTASGPGLAVTSTQPHVPGSRVPRLTLLLGARAGTVIASCMHVCWATVWLAAPPQVERVGNHVRDVGVVVLHRRALKCR
ncbi:hypothetical protein COO60DRAFT_1126007 [Scenedesmus sp. NREL 46B-D3]|nr:hypothetical protein COO60DRAFT_1126007 [Scenedesmus sp. NREL 46B-D3]